MSQEPKGLAGVRDRRPDEPHICLLLDVARQHVGHVETVS
jgi:hypothetical protein